jgi:predicted O-methyltransferase YrrM
MTVTTAAEVVALAGALPGGIPPERGAELYRFIREHRPRNCLELGVGHGASALYIGAALEANGSGTLTSVDLTSARNRRPPATDLIQLAGLSDRVDVVFEETSYTWFLHDVRVHRRRPHLGR